MAKANFEACLAVVLAHEGGYADHPDDPGGATNRGITRRTLAEWRGVSPWWALDKSAVKALGLEETRAIYRARYWDTVAGDDLPMGVDLAVFDFAVNSGPARAVRLLQAELGIAEDGIAGPVTRAAARAAATAGHAKALVAGLSDRRLAFVKSLSAFPTFGRGWTRRVDDTRTRALAMCPRATATSPTKGPREMDIFSGYKTYIVGALMLITAIAQMAGVDLPGVEGQSAMQLLMEGLAVVFLRKGIKTDAAA
ncbi:MAG: hypothetical protein KKH72_12240 [Alphaproteobacteria bacterium]|nr:hypothetical protein [Alphaproteobacteria bacterium]